MATAVVRQHARFKYTIDDSGLDWVKSEIERRMGSALGPARPFKFTTNGDAYGWAKGEDGRHHQRCSSKMVASSIAKGSRY